MEAIKANLAKLEEEAETLRKMHAQAHEADMGMVATSMTEEEREAADRRSIYIGNVSAFNFLSFINTLIELIFLLIFMHHPHLIK